MYFYRVKMTTSAYKDMAQNNILELTTRQADETVKSTVTVDGIDYDTSVDIDVIGTTINQLRKPLITVLIN